MSPAEPLAPTAPLSAWADVPAARWNNPEWQRAHTIHDPAALAALLDLPEARLRGVAETAARYPLRVTPYYLSLVVRGDLADPVLRQVLPDPAELDATGVEDATDESGDSPVPGLIHRYPDRALVLSTGSCLAHCRHCNRKRVWRRDGRPVVPDLAAIHGYLDAHDEVREVLVSGGDPLTLPPATLDALLGRLRDRPALELIRLGTRTPVVLPQLLDAERCALLGRHRPLWLNTHFNHPREVTAEAAAACGRLLAAGIPVSNQTVLLRGVNDDDTAIRDLNLKLLRIGVRPYYLYHCDPVRGAAHFRTPVARGLEILEAMRGRVSGLAQFLYAIDLPGGGGKVHLEPGAALERTATGLRFANQRGEMVEYPEGGDAG